MSRDWRNPNPFGYHGPWRQVRTDPCTGWSVVADERPDGRWDVHAVFSVTGAQVPEGPNAHNDPAPEMRALEFMLTAPIAEANTASRAGGVRAYLALRKAGVQP